MNDERALIGYGDTRDQVFNDLLGKLQTRQNEIKYNCPKDSEGCRPFLLPSGAGDFRIYWRASTGKVRWKFLWGPGAFEFGSARAVPESEN